MNWFTMKKGSLNSSIIMLTQMRRTDSVKYGNETKYELIFRYCQVIRKIERGIPIQSEIWAKFTAVCITLDRFLFDDSVSSSSIFSLILKVDNLTASLLKNKAVPTMNSKNDVIPNILGDKNLIKRLFRKKVINLVNNWPIIRKVAPLVDFSSIC